MGSLKILVVGECGDGKSTLIKCLSKGKLGVDGVTEEGKNPDTGMDPNGVTKFIELYDAGIDPNGRKVILLDTPGIGDKHVSPMELVAQIEQCLTEGSVHGVLLCSSISKNRVTLGAQVVGILADKGFVGGESKWGGFIFVGTQADRCDEDEIQNFKTATLAELNKGHDGKMNGKIDKVAAIKIKQKDNVIMMEKSDVSELTDLIGKLAGDQIKYEVPDAKEFALEMGSVLNIDTKHFEQKVIEYRIEHRGFWEDGFGRALKDLGKHTASAATFGAMGFDGDKPVLGFWNSKNWS